MCEHTRFQVELSPDEKPERFPQHAYASKSTLPDKTSVRNTDIYQHSTQGSERAGVSSESCGVFWC